MWVNPSIYKHPILGHSKNYLKSTKTNIYLGKSKNERGKKDKIKWRKENQTKSDVQLAGMVESHQTPNFVLLWKRAPNFVIVW